MSQAGELLRRMVDLLDKVGIPYMIAGSFASTFHGTPRTTQDIDLVVDPTMQSLGALLANLPQKDYYVSEEAARDAFRRRSQFNVIDMATGWKVDLIIRKACLGADIALYRLDDSKRLRDDGAAWVHLGARPGSSWRDREPILVRAL